MCELIDVSISAKLLSHIMKSDELCLIFITVSFTDRKHTLERMRGDLKHSFHFLICRISFHSVNKYLSAQPVLFPHDKSSVQSPVRVMVGNTSHSLFFLAAPYTIMQGTVQLILYQRDIPTYRHYQPNRTRPDVPN